MDCKGSKYYYSRLAKDEKEIYNCICEALLRFEPVLVVTAVSSGKIHHILNAVLFDNPVFFYLNSRNILIQQTSSGLQLVFHYDYSKSEAESMWNLTQKKLDAFMNTRIRPDMKPPAFSLYYRYRKRAYTGWEHGAACLEYYTYRWYYSTY